MADKCINSNADIAGIGIRVNFYVTILLTALTPENGRTDELLDGIYKNSVINGLSLVITAVVQTMQKQLDLYHAIFVMQILFSLNFVYAYGQRRFIRSNRTDFRMKIFIGVQTFTTMVFTVWLLYVWIKDIDFGRLRPGFGSCSSYTSSFPLVCCCSGLVPFFPNTWSDYEREFTPRGRKYGMTFLVQNHNNHDNHTNYENHSNHSNHNNHNNHKSKETPPRCSDM